MTNNAPGCEPYAENRLFSCACARGVVWCVVWCVVMFVCVAVVVMSVCASVRVRVRVCACVWARVPGSGRGGAGWSRPPRRCSRGPAAPAAPPPPAQSSTGCWPRHETIARRKGNARVRRYRACRRQPDKSPPAREASRLSPHCPVRIFSSSGANSAPVAASQTSRLDPSRFHPTSLLDARLYPHKLVRH